MFMIYGNNYTDLLKIKDNKYLPPEYYTYLSKYF